MNNKHASHEEVKKEMLGHNKDPRLNPDMVEEYNKLHLLADNRKAINDEIREIFANMKEKYNFPTSALREVFNEERKDKATVAQKESAKKDVRVCLGIDLFKWAESEELDGSDAADPIQAAADEDKKNKAAKTLKPVK